MASLSGIRKKRIAPVHEVGHFVRGEYRIDAVVPAERDHGLVGLQDDR